jgi:hypothetical protein
LSRVHTVPAANITARGVEWRPVVQTGSLPFTGIFLFPADTISPKLQPRSSNVLQCTRETNGRVGFRREHISSIFRAPTRLTRHRR